MPPNPSRLPKYRRHAASGRAVVTLDGRDIYLGKYGSPESRRKYDQLICEWIGAGRRLPVKSADITIIELIDRY